METANISTHIAHTTHEHTHSLADWPWAVRFVFASLCMHCFLPIAVRISYWSFVASPRNHSTPGRSFFCGTSSSTSWTKKMHDFSRGSLWERILNSFSILGNFGGSEQTCFNTGVCIWKRLTGVPSESHSWRGPLEAYVMLNWECNPKHVTALPWYRDVFLVLVTCSIISHCLLCVQLVMLRHMVPTSIDLSLINAATRFQMNQKIRLP